MKKQIQFLVLMALGAVLNAHAQPSTNGWNFTFTNFVIGAFWGPGLTDPEFQVYSEAGFNTVMVGRTSGNVSLSASYITAAEVQQGLDLAQEYGLGAFIDTFQQNSNTWGGVVVTNFDSGGSLQHFASLQELEWLQQTFGDYPALIGYLLGDDQGSIDWRALADTNFLQTNAPQLFPWFCGWVNPSDLANNGNPIQNAQIYPTLYEWGQSADYLVGSYCTNYWVYIGEDQFYGLLFWPMFNVAGASTTSYMNCDSLTRFPAYAAVAFGAKGIWYFCYYNEGLVESGTYWALSQVQNSETPLYAVAQQVNLRIAAWGPLVMDRTSSGLFGTLPTQPIGLAAPATNKLVAVASDHLVLGVLTKPYANPLVMVVNGLCSTNFNDLPSRAVTIQFNPQVTGIDVLEGGGSSHTNGNVITLTLQPGGGQLLELEGQLAQLTSREAIYGGLVWDANTGSAGAQDGGGTWNTSKANWLANGVNTTWNNSRYYLSPLAAVIGAGNGAAGTITVSGTINVDSLILNPAGSGNYTIGGGTLNMQIWPTILANANATINSALIVSANGMVLTKSGAGMLALGAANSLGVGVTLSQGALQLNNSSAAGSGTLTLGDANTGTNNLKLVLNSSPSMPVTVTTNGTGAVEIQGIAQYQSASGALTLNDATTLSVPGSSGDWWYAFSGNISGNVGTLTIDADSFYSGNNYRIILQGNNTFTGDVLVTANGKLQLQSGGNAIPDTANVTVNGQLRVYTADAINGLNGTGSVYTANGAQVLTVGAANGSGVFSGSLVDVALTKAGSDIQTLSGTGITYSGNTTVTGGTLRLVDTTALGSPMFTVSAGATLELNSSGDWSFPQLITGTGGVVKSGPGSLTIADTTYTGPTVVNEGTLLINGTLLPSSAVTVESGGVLGGTGTVGGMLSVQNGGTLAPGAEGIGTLTLSHSPLLGGCVLMKIEKGTAPNADSLMLGSQPLTYAGTLTVTNIGVNTLADGDTFTLFSAGSYNGDFAAMNLPVLAPGLKWNWNSSNGTLTVFSVNTSVTNLTFVISNGILGLSWPADHLGWHLQYQTNSLGTNWITIPGSDTMTSTNITINPAQPTVFYRLTYP